MKRGPDRPKFDAELVVDIAGLEDGVAVSGTTTLPDGTLIRVEVWSGGELGPFGDPESAEVEVAGGRFEATFRRSQSGQVSAAAAINADRRQPAATRAVLGEAGERLAFADFVWRDSAQHVVTTTKWL